MAEYPQKPPLKVQMRHIHFGSQLIHLEESTKPNHPLNRTLVGMDTIIGVMTMSLFMVVMIPCNWELLRSFLDAKPLQFMGKISFSFYVLHTPVMIACWRFLSFLSPHFLKSENPFVIGTLICILSIFITIIASVVMQKFIEAPFNGWGHIIAKRCQAPICSK